MFCKKENKNCNLAWLTPAKSRVTLLYKAAVTEQDILDSGGLSL